MFEYVGEKKAMDKDEIRSRVLTVIVTIVSAGGIFALIYWAASSS